MKKYLLSIIIGISFQAKAQTFTSSNLPIAVIDTYGQNIDVAYVTFVVGMGVIDNGPGVRNNITDPYNNFNSKIEIKLHGSSTLYLPKKSYGITTLDNALNKISVSLMNLPPENDWILKGAYQDKALIRDAVTFDIYKKMGHYSTRSKFFELVINGDYKGVYELQEKVKRDSNRVNIAKLKVTEITGDDITGGYIIRLDKHAVADEGWYSSYNSNISSDSANFFLYEYPKADSMPLIQKNYIKNYFDKFENVLNSSYYSSPDSGYRKYLNIESFIDNFLTNEMSRNVDCYRSSTYFYKDKDSDGDGKLHCGPVWDYNLGWENCFYNGGNNPAGWQYQVFATENFVPFWWWKYIADNSFKSELKCRYQTLRSSTLSFPVLYNYIDSMALYLDESQLRNYSRWPIMGTFIHPNPTPVPATYADEITNIKDWIWQRLTWMDSNMPGVCNVGTEDIASSNLIHSFPNPFSENITISYDVPENSKVRIELLNAIGEIVKIVSEEKRQQGNYQENVSASTLAAGIYLIKISMNNKVYYQKIIKM